ncbi:hypothetical protein V9654_004438 [Vibrio parahaemolyticus]|uniref:hypothetical protein n=1 Tax=Vibrio parahaemolyticus TaxID=670 RepID=UPI00042578AB|nr:hypothetical protein [Vibrio parahaemolyticus]EIO3939943.1 hypothetical protein [Vibrio vulnificus]EGQ8062065.1 hypothetical protein [Vibrio parahaemolyticus]EGQ9522625.1 hypothetical protein [Vibrio parahaemolyticus]EGR2205809.1 hypothetical protein [Vibrio parahaemolyticus]EHH1037874.1 hypothetical protein [Vibrio parahaemolyticus]
MFETKLQNELVQLLTAGASFKLAAGSKLQQELVQLAVAAKSGGGTLTLTGVAMKTQRELVQLSTAGKGSIVFAED